MVTNREMKVYYNRNLELEYFVLDKFFIVDVN